jgi:hypothetical protein
MTTRREIGHRANLGAGILFPPTRRKLAIFASLALRVYHQLTSPESIFHLHTLLEEELPSVRDHARWGICC